jgi:hypothetical protein
MEMVDPKKIERVVKQVFRIMLTVTLIVVAGLALLTWTVGPGPRVGHRTENLLRNIDLACTTYLHDWGTYPPGDEADLVRCLTTEVTRGDEPSLGPYLNFDGKPANRTNTAIVDGWGNPIRYRCSGTRRPGSYDLWSVGPDGKDGTDDDIGNWED